MNTPGLRDPVVLRGLSDCYWRLVHKFSRFCLHHQKCLGWHGFSGARYRGYALPKLHDSTYRNQQHCWMVEGVHFVVYLSFPLARSFLSGRTRDVFWCMSTRWLDLHACKSDCDEILICSIFIGSMLSWISRIVHSSIFGLLWKLLCHPRVICLEEWEVDHWNRYGFKWWCNSVVDLASRKMKSCGRCMGMTWYDLNDVATVRWIEAVEKTVHENHA